jgi:DHA2 family multidrug resistance protein
MTQVTSTMDFWNLAWPRFVQGFSQGFIFVPLQALSLATVTTERLGNATSGYNMLRNIGGSLGVAVATAMLARRSQQHQVALIGRLDPYSPAMDERLRDWTAHFVAHGADTFTASRRAMAMVYREAVTQAHILAYADVFWLMLSAYVAVLFLIPFMRRVRSGQGRGGRRPQGEESEARDHALAAPAE